FSSRRRHTRFDCDWSSDVCSSDLKQILKILQENARTTNAEIARQVGMAPSAILERVRKLEERGVIKSYGAQLAGHSIGRGLLAFIFVRLEDMAGEGKAAKALSRIPEALEVHHV